MAEPEARQLHTGEEADRHWKALHNRCAKLEVELAQARKELDAARGIGTVPPRADWTRGELIAICERAIVPVDEWHDRDSPGAQRSVGEVWAFLKAGCAFKVLATSGEDCCTDENTIWIEIEHPSFSSIEWGRQKGERDTYYLPTPKRLEERKGRDWY